MSLWMKKKMMMMKMMKMKMKMKKMKKKKKMLKWYDLKKMKRMDSKEKESKRVLRMRMMRRAIERCLNGCRDNLQPMHAKQRNAWRRLHRRAVGLQIGRSCGSRCR